MARLRRCSGKEAITRIAVEKLLVADALSPSPMVAHLIAECELTTWLREFDD